MLINEYAAMRLHRERSHKPRSGYNQALAGKCAMKSLSQPTRKTSHR